MVKEIYRSCFGSFRYNNVQKVYLVEFVEFNGDSLSRFALGTVQFGMEYGVCNSSGKPTQNEIDRVMEYLISEGINFLDTAIDYGDSHRAISSSISMHNNISVVSKISSVSFLNNSTLAVDKALEELGQSFLFGLLLHDTKLLNSWNENLCSTVKSLKSSGRIKYFGVSIYRNEEFLLAIENSDIDIIQIPFNIFDHRYLTLGWQKLAKDNNKLIVIRSIYLQGLLLMDVDKISPKLIDAKGYIDILDKLSLKYSVSRLELVFGFVDFFAKDCVMLFGVQNLQEAKENIDIFNQSKKLTKKLKRSDISYIVEKLKGIKEDIYNPSNWK
jgi:aryl-alcohol dehydrogenase-like predicted oxidoreductase